MSDEFANDNAIDREYALYADIFDSIDTIGLAATTKILNDALHDYIVCMGTGEEWQRAYRNAGKDPDVTIGRLEDLLSGVNLHGFGIKAEAIRQTAGIRTP